MADYKKFIDAFITAHPLLKKQEAYNEGQKQWKEVKGKLEENPAAITEKIHEFKLKEAKFNAQKLQAWSNFRKPVAKKSPVKSKEVLPIPDLPKSVEENESSDQLSPKKARLESDPAPAEAAAQIPAAAAAPAPAQEKNAEELKIMKAQYFNLQGLDNSGFKSLENQKQMNMLRKQITEKEKYGKKLVTKAQWQKQYRGKKNEVIANLSKTSPLALKSLKPFMREKVGRPSLDCDQPGIIEAILDLVQCTTATDAKRRSEILRTTRTLDDLHTALQGLGYTLSRSATYYR